MKPGRSPEDQDIIKILKDLESLKAEYPAELLAARRAAFLDQLEKQGQVEAAEDLPSKDQKLAELFGGLKSVEDHQYPSKLLTARRAAFQRQIARANRVSFWHTLRAAIAGAFARPPGPPRRSMRELRTSLVIAGLAVAAFAGFLLYGNRSQLAAAPSAQNEIPDPITALATSTPEIEITCKPGFEPPLCLAGEFNQSEDLTYQGNGSARPAVAKDTMPGDDDLHKAAFINDGRYGPGTSWVSRSANSWIKIDLGKAALINTVTFGRDRLGALNDRDPGQFVIAVALTDDVYANGDSSNDDVEYLPVYDSEQTGFDGVISGSETVMAQFGSLPVRFVKITFENPGTAIDEVEVFLKSPVFAGYPTRVTDDNSPFSTATLLPTQSLVPTSTSTPIPTGTPVPTDTLTPVPTDTAVPTDTPTPEPTDTEVPVPTDTPPPMPTEEPVPTDVLELTIVPIDP